MASTGFTLLSLSSNTEIVKQQTRTLLSSVTDNFSISTFLFFDTNFYKQNTRCMKRKLEILSLLLLSQSKSKSKSKVKSQKSKVKRTWSDSNLLCHPPPTHHTNFSQQPNIQKNQKFNSGLCYSRV